MKTMNLLGTLLLFLFIIGFVECSDDEEKTDPSYHLKMSVSSCEVMQGSTVSINLIAHENTTVDITNPELADALYTWEGREDFWAVIKITGKQKGETGIIITDHETGESATITVKVTEYPMPRLAVKKPEVNLLEMMDFYLYNDDSMPITMGDLSSVCDSIVWSVKGESGTMRVFEQESGENWHKEHLTMGWGHCFRFPGKHVTYLIAWKDNKELFRDQLDVTVTNGKDFLAYNWDDITKNSQAWTSYMDVLKSSPNLITTYGLIDFVPYVETRVFGSDFDESFKILYDYFCELYSQPTYEAPEDKSIFTQYEQLFSEQKKYPGEYPCAIWSTERTNLVLLMLDDNQDGPAYVVYAEPKKQSSITAI